MQTFMNKCKHSSWIHEYICQYLYYLCYNGIIKFTRVQNNNLYGQDFNLQGPVCNFINPNVNLERRAPFHFVSSVQNFIIWFQLYSEYYFNDNESSIISLFMFDIDIFKSTWIDSSFEIINFTYNLSDLIHQYF